MSACATLAGMHAFTRYTPPPIPKPRACDACNGFAAEVHVPTDDGEGGALACWLCAHAIAEHGATLATAPQVVGACTCDKLTIFPADVIAKIPPNPSRRASDHPGNAPAHMWARWGRQAWHLKGAPCAPSRPDETQSTIVAYPEPGLGEICDACRYTAKIGRAGVS